MLASTLQTLKLALHNGDYANAAREGVAPIPSTMGSKEGLGHGQETMSRDSSKALLRGMRGASKMKASFQTWTVWT